MAKKNAFYAQSGGVTAVINASACGVIETARKHKDQIGKVYRRAPSDRAASSSSRLRRTGANTNA